ncbi:hypothetical protein B0H66DRAFT_568095 [Apodospora peruviana]|uniref:GA4 desaturase n=1 Tax=Apodospora peruviana TaxID=516989 RepID=A0AAE0HWL3_9PEZI|nr:hypothetical protein B0H66DRAFT_568095 [Apodospora peruviana]
MSPTVTTTQEKEGHINPPNPVLGKLRYVPAGYTPKPSPHNYHLPAISEFGDIRLLPLRSMRPVPTVASLPSATNHAQLATHGFTAVHHPTTLHSAPYTLSSWKDPALLKEFYLPDTEAMLKQINGCNTVIAEAVLLRSAIWTESDALATHAGHGGPQPEDVPTPPPDNTKKNLETGFPSFIGFNSSTGGVSPAPKPHMDYSPAGARTHIRKYHLSLTAAAKDIIAAEDELLSQGKPLKDHYSDSNGPHWALYSIWRPLKLVKRDPLALLDQRTLADEDYIPVPIKTPCLGRDTMETHDAGGFLARYGTGHEWNWIDDQKPEEVLIIGLFDSDMESKGWKASGGTLHSSVELPGTEGEEPRESLEVRCLCIW